MGCEHPLAALFYWPEFSFVLKRDIVKIVKRRQILGYKMAGMNWDRGFKRVSLILSNTCAVISGLYTYKWSVS
jgi:hypothetical protein